MRRLQFLTLCLYLISLAACGPNIPVEVKVVYAGLPDEVDFNYHVKPILSDKCFACHGPDLANQKGDLRLDTPEGAYALLGEKQDRAAIVPGNLNKSQVYERIFSVEPDQIMPPPESHLTLSAEEKAVLTKWMEQGAEYKPHWAFIKPEKLNPPKTESVEHPVDQFILDRLKKKGLDFSEKASKETLIRRASFDLTGLPPTLEEIDAFLNDKSPNAYENLLDRLLSSRAYGERMAAYWMDVARFADSDGYLDDKHRDFTPWRDWVIQAFNQNMPYDQFATWQLAGDLIPEPTKESVLATAFNRLNKRNSEAGIVFEEFRVEYHADRTNTLGTAFMGLSVECARCHDHKYDPITQKDYYKLFGFFNSNFEIGHASYGPGITPGPTLLLSSEVEDRRLDSLKQFINQLEDKVAQRSDVSDHYETWKGKQQLSTQTLAKKIEKSLVAHYSFDQFDPQNEKSPEQRGRADPAVASRAIIKPGKSGQAFFVSDYNSIKLGEKVGWYERTDPFSIQLWLYPDTLYEETNMLWHCEDLRLGQKGYTLGMTHNQLFFAISNTWPQNAIQVKTKQALPVKEWSQVTMTYDGSSTATGIQLYINGERQTVEIEYDHLYRSILYEPDIHTYGFAGLTLGSRDKYIPFKNGGIDEVKVYDRKLVPIEVMFTYDQGKASKWLLDSKKEAMLPYYHAHFDPVLDNYKAELQALRAEENNLLTSIQEIMVMGELPEPRPTYVLERGIYDAHGEEVEPGVPDAIMPYDEKLPKNRLGLTKWLFDEQNPLTARVFVNRIWQMHFGQGLVKTSEDFGNQGDLPSHPELLDWLAVQFMESGWDIKAMHKLILTSETYQQNSSVSQELLEKDPENILLAHGPSYRLPAEMVRDNALAISGLLVSEIGGASVYPYQPKGIWDGLTNKSWAYKYLQEPGNGLYRRSLYTIWKRTAPPPSMLIFDIADRGICTVRRKTTSTPLQALVLLNDPQFIEAARVLAEKLMHKESALPDRLTNAFRLVTGRHPDQQEQQMLKAFYQEEYDQFKDDPGAALSFLNTGESTVDVDLNPTEIAALGVVINGIMNTSEGYTKR